MNKERMLRLREITAAMKPEQFDISTWKCGTTMCIGGNAAMDPVFNTEGLKLDTAPWDAGIVIPTYGSSNSFEALVEFFELSWPEANFIFDGTCYLEEHDTVEGEWKAIEDEWGDNLPKPDEEITIADALAHIDYVIGRHK